jgi:hypothetical protein
MVADAFPRRLIRKVENENFPLIGLTAIREIREYLDRAEERALRTAREMGASADDIADALGITRQGAYYKLKTLEGDEDEAGEETTEIVVPDLEETSTED